MCRRGRAALIFNSICDAGLRMPGGAGVLPRRCCGMRTAQELVLHSGPGDAWAGQHLLGVREIQPMCSEVAAVFRLVSSYISHNAATFLVTCKNKIEPTTVYETAR